jgi:hypothetical protein
MQRMVEVKKFVANWPTARTRLKELDWGFASVMAMEDSCRSESAPSLRNRSARKSRTYRP